MSNLPANIGNMATGLANSITQAAGGVSSGELYCRFTKHGEWIYGVDDTEVEEGSKWAVNPMGFKHGYIAWPEGGGAPAGEVLVPATDVMPLEEDLPPVAGRWSKAVSVQLRCLDGEDEGTQIIWKGNSVGGRKAYAKLLQAVVEKISAGEDAFVPVVMLENDSYQHKQYGKIYTPEFNVVDFVTMDGEVNAPAAATAEQEDAPAESGGEGEDAGTSEPPRRRRRRKAAA